MKLAAHNGHAQGCAPNTLAHGQKVEFLLYRDASPEPYRSLHLWLNVTAE